MRALIACERSGRVRSALRDVGVDAWSCDIVPADDGDPHHITGDALSALGDDWDLLIAHPPCTYLAAVATACLDERCSHVRRGNTCTSPHGALRRQLVIDAALFFRAFLDAEHIPRRAVENPIPHRKAGELMGPPSAITHPYQFGDPHAKRTGWWLRGLAPLQPTRVVRPTHRLVGAQRRDRGRYLPHLDGKYRNNADRSRIRSVTPPGTAAAIAAQWTGPVGTLF